MEGRDRPYGARKEALADADTAASTATVGTGPEGRASDAFGAVSEAAPAAGALNEVLRNAERSAIYHKAREGFLEKCHRMVMFLVLTSGSASLTALASELTAARLAFLLVPTVMGALDMVFAFSRSARDHAVLAGRFLDLAADCQEFGDDAQRLEARFYRLCGEEPPVYEALNAISHNRVCGALGSYADPYKLRVRFHHRLLRNLIRFSADDFPPVGKLQEIAEAPSV